MMTFRSKRGFGLLIFLVVFDLLFVVGLVAFLSVRGRLVLPLIAALPVLAFSIALVTWVFAATDYSVRGQTLVIRSGPFHWKVAIQTIESVRPSMDPTSAPALSLDRLLIAYRAGGNAKQILVSPEDRDGFVRALRAVNPNIALNS